MASVWLSEHILLRDFCHSDIVELPPFFVKYISDEHIVVARQSATVVDADSVQVVRVLVHARIGFFYFLVDLCELRLHSIHLSGDTCCVLGQEVYGFCYILRILTFEVGLLEWLKQL